MRKEAGKPRCDWQPEPKRQALTFARALHHALLTRLGDAYRIWPNKSVILRVDIVSNQETIDAFLLKEDETWTKTIPVVTHAIEKEND